MDRRSFFSLPAAGWAALRSLPAAPLTQGERDRALSHLHGTRKQFLDLVTPATTAQWSWKPAPDRWSLEEIAEHITIAEQILFETLQTALKKPPAKVNTEEQKKKDALIVTAVPSREQRVQAPEAFRPTKAFPTKEALVQVFKERRDRNIAFVRETDISLRDYLLEHPALGMVDAYQWMLFLSAHCERHLAQMREVMGTPGYPRS